MEIDRQVCHGFELFDEALETRDRLAGFHGVLGNLLVEEGGAGGLAGQFAGGKRHEACQDPGLHPGNGAKRQAAFLQTGFQLLHVFGVEMVLHRFAVGEHGEFGMHQKGGSRLLLVEDFI